MIAESPIIKSLLDNDLYTYTVGQIAWKYFPESIVSYKFINRNRTPFPPNFVEELNHQINLLSQLSFNVKEIDYLHSLSYLSIDYILWLSSYKFYPNQLSISMSDDNQLSISIKGSWATTIFWEVPLLALISELFYKLSGLKHKGSWKDRILMKAQNLSHSGCIWSDFGTRRRFSFKTQNKVVETMKYFQGFIGTSNVFLAMKHSKDKIQVKPIGTMSHQGPMAMMAKFGVKNANKEWRNVWKKCYGNDLSIFLTDTFTTDIFLDEFSKEETQEWNGLRQDSGDPYHWMEKVLAHYNNLGVPTNNKTFVFSDSLNVEKYTKISMEYRKFGTIIGGIGTNFSNDVGHKPLNIVIKLTSADFGEGEKEVVKLSDDLGKNTGNSDLIKSIQSELNI